MKPKINLEKFICSYVKWNNIQDALKDQGLKCWNGEIVEIESEDERMKKEILDLVSISGNGNQFEEIKDWLEKQGKQKPFDYENATIIQKDFAPKEVTFTQEVETGNGNIKALVTGISPAESLGISPEKYEEIVNECIYGEEKPTDKVEPKFHEGDWVVCEVTCSVYQIKNCIENLNNHKYGYDLTNGGYIGSDEVNYYHLWTINDAKPGDVLVSKHGVPFIYNGNYNSDFLGAYCGITTGGDFRVGTEKCQWSSNKNVHPATKEQRDLLFQKMKEAGYEWSEKTHELKKIDVELTDFEKSLKHIMIETLECGDTRNLKADAEMLLRLAQKPAWKEDDTLLDLLHKMPSCITVNGIDYHFVLKKTIAYMVFYEGEGEEGRDKIIFWMAGEPVPLLTAMLNKLKEEGLLE